MNRIKVVNKADDATAEALHERYRFLPSDHTDFLIDGFEEAAVDKVFIESV